MKRARFLFTDHLARLLPPHRRAAAIFHEFAGPQSAKHLLEGLGIPHTEIGLVIINGEQRHLSHHVENRDSILVQASLGPPVSEGPPRFVLDGHLGRLTRSLRMLGMDCRYRDDLDDGELEAISIGEGRQLLT